MADFGCMDINMEPLVVTVPSTHRLSRCRRIRREALAGAPLVYFARRVSPGSYDQSLSQVYGAAATPDIVRTESSKERMLVAVAEGAGITLLPEERAATRPLP